MEPRLFDSVEYVVSSIFDCRVCMEESTSGSLSAGMRMTGFKSCQKKRISIVL